MSRVGRLARNGFALGGISAPAIAPGRIRSTIVLSRVAAARHLRRSGRGARRHVAVEARLLLVVERAVERLQRRLHGVERLERGVDALLHRLEPRRRRRGNVLRAVGGKPLRRLLGGPAQAFERVALLLVGADALPDRVERPAVELGCLRGAAADQLLDHGTERAVAAGPQHGIAAFHRAGAGPFFATAATAPVVTACAPAIAIARAFLHAILAAILVTSLVLAGRLCAVWLAVLLVTLNVRGAPPLVEGSGGRALAVAAVTVVMAAAGVNGTGGVAVNV